MRKENPNNEFYQEIDKLVKLRTPLKLLIVGAFSMAVFITKVQLEAKENTEKIIELITWKKKVEIFMTKQNIRDAVKDMNTKAGNKITKEQEEGILKSIGE